MIKLITLAVCFFLLYRFVLPPSLKEGNKPPSKDANHPDDTIDIDYEEVS